VRAILMQGWTTIRGASGVTQVVQQQPAWLDLAPYQDCAFWVDGRSATSSPNVNIETAPARDDSLFVSMVVLPVPTGGTLVGSAMLARANTPLARFVRWKLTGTGVWDATFRIWAAVNAPGV